MTVQPPPDSAPPQPPLPEIVDGIEMPTEPAHSTPSSPVAQIAPQPTDDGRQPVREGDLAAFAELLTRFATRIEKASPGRKYRPLRTAWSDALAETAAAPSRVNLNAVSDLVINALQLGCESGKIAVVDACLDCIHRLFEYGHLGSTVLPPLTATPPAAEQTDMKLDGPPNALDTVIKMVCSCLEVKDEEVYLRMVQTLLTAATRTRSGLHHGMLLAAVRTIYNIYLNAYTSGTRTTARVSLMQILNLVFTRMEAESAEDVTTTSFSSGKSATDGVDVARLAPPAEESTDVSSDFASVLQNDAYLLFRALCKLSAKDVPDGTAVDTVTIHSKLLSLELLRNLVGNSGPVFRSSERFIYALRQYLALSLLTNCLSSSMEVVDVSFDIFEMLLRKDNLRPLLKTEIGALFDTVIFRFLESPTAGPLRKRRALTFINRLSNDRQTMADMFLNYDCDITSPKIFERIVNILSATAQDKSKTDAPTSTAQSPPGLGQIDMRVLAVTSIIQVVRALRNWSKPIEDSKEERKIDFAASENSQPDPVEDQEEVNGKHNVDDVVSPVSADEDDEETHEGEAKDSERPARTRTSGSGRMVMGVVSEGSDLDTSKFEEALRAKREMAEGIKLFNTKPKRGIEYLTKAGRLRKDPNEIAQFLQNAESLDAAMIGEFIGDGNVFNVSVMHAYTDMHDFSDLTFDGALRKHLSGFRLPGEAQKIDRIMEKYASRYCECNPDVFANADAAYVLAYSTIMLHTDAHNNTIKNKMTKEDFIKNNRGINDGGDLDPVFLGGLYDRITKTEIRLGSSLKDSTPGADAKKALDNSAAAATLDPAQKAKQFKEESERLMAGTKALFADKRRSAEDYTYYSATNVYHARLMFDTAWYPVLAAVSLNLEEASPSDTNVVALCLDGFRNGIAIASTFGMATTKDAFVSSLAKFTHLNSISEMRPKNVECVRMILAIAAMEGNNLGEQWVVIVRAISQLEQIRAVTAGNPGKYLLQNAPLVGIGGLQGTDDQGGSAGYVRTVSSSSAGSGTADGSHSSTSPANGSRRHSASRNGSSPVSSGNSVLARIDSKAASMASTIAESEIERIFSNSSQLSASGVSDFCGALCTVALEELGEGDSPRIFCLQKIVEMAYYNMASRTRIEWGKIWTQMGPFFASAMCHSNRDVAMYSIDALRQLASKFLDKDELSNFSFQRSFLKPFEVCFSKSKVVAVRELVLTCISQIVLARASNIKSGWKSVFTVLSMAADDRTESIMNFGWQIVDSIARKYIGVLDDVFVDAVTGIASYAHTGLSSVVSLAAIEMLAGRCAMALADGNALSVLRESPADEFFSADVDAHMGAWFPLLTGLAGAMQDEREKVRVGANDGLYRVLTEHGGRFAPSMWTLVFRGVLAPVFDDVKHLAGSTDEAEVAAIAEWAGSAGSASLKSLVDVFVLHVKVTRGLIGEIMSLIRGWIVQENEVVAREGMSVLARLIMSSGDVLSEEEWDGIVEAVDKLFSDTMPHEILGPADSEDKIDFRVVRAKCVVQLLLIQVVQEIVVTFYQQLSTQQICILSESLHGSYKFAHEFNGDIELRYSLWRAGFMNQVPNLLKQETNGLMVQIRIALWLVLDEKRGEDDTRLTELCKSVLESYIEGCDGDERGEERREVQAMATVVGVVAYAAGSAAGVGEKVSGLALKALVESDDRSVRRALGELFGREGEKNEGEIPGESVERIVRVTGRLEEDNGMRQVTNDVVGSLHKVGGVQQVVLLVEEEENCFVKVVGKATSEMLLCSVGSVRGVGVAAIVTLEQVPRVASIVDAAQLD